jgi:predicted acetylornithine/succinylornithine family transaminase
VDGVSQTAILETYKRMNVAPTSGRGSWLFDDSGGRYLDFIGGIATNSIGHAHPALVSAIKEQSERLLHCSNLYEMPIQKEVATLLADHTDFDRTFFCNSGAEAVEAAIKLARKHAHEAHGPEKYEILTFTGGFHGRTYGGLSATAKQSIQEGFGPLVDGFVYAPFGDLEAVREKVGPQTAAILVEPIQGEGGINPAPEGFLEGLRELCDEHGAMLVFDEVQTGTGRTGHLYAYQGMGVVPDTLTSAKGLGGGVPVGALLAKEEFVSIGPGDHGSTFGGNPLAMAAVKAVLGVVADEDFLAEVRFKGNVLKHALERVAAKVPGAEVRGEGLLLGLDLGEDLAPAVFERCLADGLLVNLLGGGTLRLAPPLTVSRSEIRSALDTLRQAVEAAGGPSRESTEPDEPDGSAGSAVA